MEHAYKPHIFVGVALYIPKIYEVVYMLPYCRFYCCIITRDV